MTPRWKGGDRDPRRWTDFPKCHSKCGKSRVPWTTCLTWSPGSPTAPGCLTRLKLSDIHASQWTGEGVLKNKGMHHIFSVAVPPSEMSTLSWDLYTQSRLNCGWIWCLSGGKSHLDQIQAALGKTSPGQIPSWTYGRAVILRSSFGLSLSGESFLLFSKKINLC